MIPFKQIPNQAEHAVSQAEMAWVHEQLKTPYKWGAVIKPAGLLVDCPTIFRKGDTWYMMYTGIDPDGAERGYDTYLATSKDLLHWDQQDKVLARSGDGWDSKQQDGGFALLDIAWEGPQSIHSHDNKYWASYIGGALPGYEPDPLQIGLARTDDPTVAKIWERLPEPILRMDDADTRHFEKGTLYKSFIFKEETQTLGYPYVMYYNGKAGENSKERIGIAVSADMVNWERYGDTAIIDNTDHPDNIISGDPQIIRMGDLWVMNYFVYYRNQGAFDTFACSKDLVNWTKWTGEPTIKPSEEWDNLFAHKPFIIKHEGVVYHFYCACNHNKERFIAVATSEDLRKRK